MDSSNRSIYKSPTPKMARYLHRIQQIMGNRSRTPSPLGSRAKAVIKPNLFGNYLKYQLTFKILCSFFDNYKNSMSRLFFSNLRTHQKQKVQQVYRYVAIEKLQGNPITVDSHIVVKILSNSLKSLLRRRKKQYFEQIKKNSQYLFLKNSQMAESKLLYHQSPKDNTIRGIFHILMVYQKKNMRQKCTLFNFLKYRANNLSQKIPKKSASLFRTLNKILNKKLGYFFKQMQFQALKKSESTKKFINLAKLLQLKNKQKIISKILQLKIVYNSQTFDQKISMKSQMNNQQNANHNIKTNIQENNVLIFHRKLKKLLLIRVIDAFIKIKAMKNQGKINKQKQSKDNYWAKQLSVFLEERKKNQSNAAELQKKIYSLIQNTEKKQHVYGQQFKMVKTLNSQHKNFRLV